MEATRKGDFVELKFTGYSNGQVFDSNIEEDLKKMQVEKKPEPTIVIIGQGMLVSGLDAALEGKEIGKEYEIRLGPKEAFGERNPGLLKTIPLKVFTEKNIDPRPGMVLNLDEMIAKIITVSGARVITDFNNPLAGKEVQYKFIMARKIDEENEKVKFLFEMLLRFAPEYEIKEKVVLKGPKPLEALVNAFKDKFKELIGKELFFELKEEKTEKEKKEEKEHEKIAAKAEEIKAEAEDKTKDAGEKREEDINSKIKE